ncbi:serine/threonine-protein phosphatase [Maritimibacter sp. 55A14]|uniref:PP2C family protein-serine/threonine phosphatase n=1 Tax=Maritimibacter sp. 55A14 TaxID=2174844 RepID=UPI000D60E9C4|nr:protein phosphatase 2C domain-containing protein [Maritimibacter sp. 55A14]PWE31391.1 serine/threonine-protein phosphatase [Maritimibacter sp. 55A14]
MWKSPEPRFDVASAICQGGRDYQEDTIVIDFPTGTDIGVAVLADGMGGHAAGDVASKIVVTEVFSELKFESASFGEREPEIPAYLTSAAANANACVRNYVMQNPRVRGMGATLVSLVMVENRMYWMSIGDSPLYLMRGGKMRQLNEDHSMAPQIDAMVRAGMIDAEAGRDHPDRNCLTSVIIGDRVARSDCPKTPFTLEVGDIVVVTSDGLQYLDEPKIEKILYKYRRRKSAEIAEHLLAAINDLADPEQDNVSFAVIKLNHNKPATHAVRRKPVDLVEENMSRTTRVVSIEDARPGDAEVAADETPPSRTASGGVSER